jgi:hypothetical protein
MTDQPVCERCGQIHHRCSKHRIRRDEHGNLVPCGQWPIRGLDACKTHSGLRKEVAKAEGERRLQEAEVHARLATMLAEHGRDPATVDPTSELLRILAGSLAMRDVLELLVAELAPTGTPAYEIQEYDEQGNPRGGPTYLPAKPAGVYGPDHKGDGKPHVLVVMLADWSDRAARQAKLAIDAGIDERRVRIVEQQAEQLGQVVRAVAASLIGRVSEIVDDPAVTRLLQSELPAIVRGAIETSGVIDTTATEED